MLTIGKLKFMKNRWTIRRAMGVYGVFVQVGKDGSNTEVLDYFQHEADAARFVRSLSELPDGCRAAIEHGRAVAEPMSETEARARETLAAAVAASPD